jgi:hypothetical protein
MHFQCICIMQPQGTDMPVETCAVLQNDCINIVSAWPSLRTSMNYKCEYICTDSYDNGINEAPERTGVELVYVQYC